MFEGLGAHLIDSDELARDVVRPHMKAWEDIVAHFGTGVLNEDLTLDRQRLADTVFNDHERLEKLNQIVHPAVLEEDERRVEEIRKRNPQAIVIKDVPLLIETGLQKSVDKVVVVSAGEENQLKRLLSKGFTEEDAWKRIKAQLSMAEKVKFADFIVNNDGSFEETREQVIEIFESLTRLS